MIIGTFIYMYHISYDNVIQTGVNMKNLKKKDEEDVHLEWEWVESGTDDKNISFVAMD